MSKCISLCILAVFLWATVTRAECDCKKAWDRETRWSVGLVGNAQHPLFNNCCLVKGSISQTELCCWGKRVIVSGTYWMKEETE